MKKVKKSLFVFFREYGTKVSPLPNDQLKQLDSARFTDIDSISEKIVNKVPEVTKKSIDIIQKMNPARELIDDVNNRGGGILYTKIVNPRQVGKYLYIVKLVRKY